MKRFTHFALTTLIGIALLNGCGGDPAPDNHAPVATAQNVATAEDTAKTLTLAGTDEDSGDTLTYSVASNPSHGTLSGTAPNLTYTPTANFNGSDSFTFTVNDGTVDSSAATVTLTVSAVNDAPSASDFGMTLDVDALNISTDWKSASSAADLEGDSLTATVTTLGDHHGTFTLSGNTLRYHLDANTTHADTGVLSISDGHDTVNVTVTVDILYWKQAAAGESHTVALKSDGTLWAWGNNNKGQLGDGTTDDHLTPVQESTHATDWSAVTAGEYHTVALKSDGTLWAWGYNHKGQLGDNNTTDRHVPTQEDSHATNWSAVAAGWWHTVALKTNGTLYAWGFNDKGQLGNGTNEESHKPFQEDSNATDWSAVSAGTWHTVALKTNGTLYAWGFNDKGQLGDKSTTNRLVPTREDSNTTNWSTVAAGGWHTVALTTDGTLYAWGANSKGQLGNGDDAKSKIPIEVNDDADWSAMAAGAWDTVATKTDGTLYAWGYNLHGQLGNGTSQDKNIPTIEFNSYTDWSTVAIGYYYTVAIKTDGTLWAWGWNNKGQLGDGTFTKKKTPIALIERH